MTTARQEALLMVQSLPENQLHFILDIMKSLSKFMPTDTNTAKDRDNAFMVLESLKRKIPDLNYEKELAEYREERYS